MGLDCSYGFWNGPYSQFMRWRIWLAKQIGIPLGLMDGFYAWEWDGDELRLDTRFHEMWVMSGNNNCFWETLLATQELGRSIEWRSINDPLVSILHHSDCDGRIRWWECKAISLRLLSIIRQVDDDTEFPLFDGKHPQAGQKIWSRWQDGRGCYDGMVPATKRAAVACLKAWKNRKDISFR